MSMSPHCTRFALVFSAFGLLTFSVHAQPVDFTEFEIESFPLTNDVFPEVFWTTSATEAMIDETPNASVNVLYGPNSALGKRFVGQLYPGPRDDRRADDDVIGFVVGFEPEDADLLGDRDANYVLIDWKGVTQSFNFTDPPGGDFFHEATLGGPMPAGLALSRVNGLPTADELWQHVDSEDGIDGGVTELTRARSLGSTGYDRSPTAEPYTFDITYTADRVSVIVDGKLELDVKGEFEDGRFGLYTGWHGPTPVFANFEVSDAVPLPDAFPEVTINRETGELTVSNPSSSSTQFAQYTMTSAAGSFDVSSWTSITDNYDDGTATSVDADAWGVDSSTASNLAESEVGGADGATLAAGQSVSLGNAWTPSRFEDVTVSFEQPDGLIVPVVPNFVGNNDLSFDRSDLNTDGTVDEADWLLFFPHSLSEFDDTTATQAALMGDLDGDFDNDVVDFGLFKADFDLAQGAGALAALEASVPEPSSALLVMLIGVVAFAWRQRRATVLLLAVALLLPSADPASAQPVDFFDFTLERFPVTTFVDAEWDVFEDTATVIGNANASVLYSPSNVLGKRIQGFLSPSTDDDVVGFVLGFQPGDASFGDDSADASYLLLDWKGTNQSFNFDDPADPDPVFSNLTGGGPMPAGLGLSRVTGLVTADELWQHENLPENTLGGVEELNRGLVRGSTGYDRDAAAEPVEFDILYTAETVLVRVNGEIEFFESGSFTDGRFGLYTAWQSAGPTFSDFEISDGNLDLSTLFLRADVNRETGDIVLSNNTSSTVALDFYQFGSGGGSLSPDWEGLADGEAGADVAAGVSWVEAGGADAGAIGELFLQDAAGDMSGLSLANGESVTLKSAYNTAVNAEDLSFNYRFPDGKLNVGLVTYTGEAPDPLSGDCNGDAVVDAADLVCVATIEERDIVLTVLNTLPGDLNGNGDVAFADFLVLSASFGDPTKTAYTDGNIDLVGDVAFADFLILSANFGLTPAPAATAASVPEPSGLVPLAACGLLVSLVRRRHRQRA